MTFNAPVEPVRCIEESVGLNHGHAHEHQCVAAVCHDGQGGCAMVLERELTSSSISSCETTSSLERCDPYLHQNRSTCEHVREERNEGGHALDPGAADPVRLVQYYLG